MKQRLLAVVLLFCPLVLSAQTKEVLGFWQIVEDEKPESIVAIYEYKGAVYGRMIAIYDDDGMKIVETMKNPKEKAKGIKGNPTIVGLDFIWKLRPDSSGRLSGLVVDPDSGRNFSCDMHFDKGKGKLVMRGKLLFFSQSQYWPRINEKDLPAEARVDVSKFVPSSHID